MTILSSRTVLVSFCKNTHHYVVCEENDPRRALETARSFHPDLILLDLIMPQEDGTEVATQITSDWMLHSVPIVFVTALITQEEARDGRRIEGHRVVPKPGHGSELIKVVEESLPKWFNNSSQTAIFLTQLLWRTARIFPQLG